MQFIQEKDLLYLLYFNHKNRKAQKAKRWWPKFKTVIYFLLYVDINNYIACESFLVILLMKQLNVFFFFFYWKPPRCKTWLFFTVVSLYIYLTNKPAQT